MKLLHRGPDDSQACYFKGDDFFTPFTRNRAIPIGNLTSQFFANLYLNGFDHYVKEDPALPPLYPLRG